MILEIACINELVFNPCGLVLENIQEETEGKDYFAHDFEINKHKVKYRQAKITPTKIGQFVTFWKRNKSGFTEPHHAEDDFHYFLIASRQGERLGVFIFSKKNLIENKILTTENQPGKRGFRVYPSWDTPENKQAQKTQNWQSECFITLEGKDPTAIKKAKALLL